ncbi:MAG: hypothetical protein RIR59_1591 [Pseudomonadota bacterium]|jgi:hypothetical protein
MTIGDRVELTGLLGWMPDFGVYLLLLDGGRFRVLHIDAPDPKLSGHQVHVIGRKGGPHVIEVDAMRRA